MKKALSYAEFLAITRNSAMTGCDDNRYAFINGHMFDLTRWEITGHEDHFVVSVYDASSSDAGWNASYGGYDMPESDFLEAFDFTTVEEANEYLVERIKYKLIQV